MPFFASAFKTLIYRAKGEHTPETPPFVHDSTSKEWTQAAGPLPFFLHESDRVEQVGVERQAGAKAQQGEEGGRGKDRLLAEENHSPSS
jgi:hypothetical protein